MNEPVRAVLDTNLWISHLISKRLIGLDLWLAQERIRLLFSEESLGEFIQVVHRPKLRPYFSEQDLSDLLKCFSQYGELISVASQVTMCRDPKDNFLLALAKDGDVDFLITGDKDLLDLKSFGQTKIVTFSYFESAMSPTP